jgi:hypothetical protein
LRVTELLDKGLITARFFNRVEVCALHVLDDRKLQGLSVRHVENCHRHLVQPGELRRPPAPLAGDQFVALSPAWRRPDHKRLHDPMVLQGVGQFLQVLGAEFPPRVAWVGLQHRNRDIRRV